MHDHFKVLNSKKIHVTTRNPAWVQDGDNRDAAGRPITKYTVEIQDLSEDQIPGIQIKIYNLAKDINVALQQKYVG